MSFCLSVYFSSLLQQRKVRTKLLREFIHIESTITCVCVCVFTGLAGWRVGAVLPSCAHNESTSEGWTLGMLL